MNVSFILAAYNVGPYIDACLASLLPELQPGDELIVVNDGSTDDTRARLGAALAQWPQAIIVDQPNSGVSCARNVGLQHAKGDYVLLLDGDDVVLGPGLRVARSQLAQIQPDILVMDFIEWPQTPGQPERPSPKRSHRPGEVTSNAPAHVVETLNDCIPCIWSRFIRRSVFSGLGPAPFPAWSMYDDLAATVHIVAQAQTLLYLPLATMKYRIRAGSLTQLRSTRSCTDMVKAALHATTVTQQFPQDTQVKAAATRFLARKWMDAVKLSRQAQGKQLLIQQSLLNDINETLLRAPKSDLLPLLQSGRKDERKAHRHLMLARLHSGLYARTMAKLAERKQRRAHHG
ncbi:MAG: putative exopolysaccharide biosynthesis protein sugar transferase [Pseudomonadota bacterium]|jgi:glycosyltransferase involved in cell wall biosynthesis